MNFSNTRLHAIADGDNAGWFFEFIQKTGLNAEFHSFGENHRFVQQDIHFPAADIILMPEENALQCRDFAKDTLWAVPKEAWIIHSELQAILLKKLRDRLNSKT